jgi:hypothetical protein
MNAPIAARDWTPEEKDCYMALIQLMRLTEDEAIRLDCWRQIEEMKNRHRGHIPKECHD